MKHLLAFFLIVFPLGFVSAQVELLRNSSEGKVSWIAELQRDNDWMRLQGISYRKVVIVNNSNIKLPFQLCFPSGPWATFEIDPTSVQTYDLLSFDRLNIRVTTQGKAPVEYYLIGGERYEIIWNASRGLWDVNRIIID